MSKKNSHVSETPATQALKRAGVAFTEHVYDYDSERDSNVIEVYVRRLRQLLGEQRIETRRGQGYVFVDDVR